MSDRPLVAGIRAWLRPPRAHGEVIEDRTVSFLELFYDLVFVVLIARIAHTLASDVSWTGVRDFALVFSLVWIAWANGTAYHELHGGEDGRSRSYIFAQMSLLVPLSVFAGHATTDTGDGRGFAVVYALLLVSSAGSGSTSAARTPPRCGASPAATSSESERSRR